MQAEETNHGDKDNKVENVSAKLDEYINSIAKKEGYITYNVDKRNISLKGGSYMGMLFEIDIKGKTESGDKETNVFVKRIVHTNAPLTFDLAEVYKRETFVYTDLIKEIYDLQNSENVPIEERFKIANAFDECNDETIILENLTARGFKTYYRMDVINLEYAELAIKDLARLHGLSLALEIKRPEYFEKKIKSMNCLYAFDKKWHGYTHNMCLFASQFLAGDMRKKIVPLLMNAVDKYPNYMNDTSCTKTVCHGDFRHNNVMVKEADGKPIDVVAVDYQITHFGNPVLDFLYFIFWGTDQEFRKKHLEHLKNLYHQYLGVFLKYFDIEVEDVYPKKEFEKQYQDKLDFGLMISVFYLPFLFPPEDDIPDVTGTKESANKFSIKVDPKYGERFREIVDDFIQWGYL